MSKKKLALIFPHIPNPRMIKRVKALLTNYDVHVIYWDRDLGNKKINELPNNVKFTIIKKKANEGSPLKRIRTTYSVIKAVISIAKEVSPDILYISKTDMLLAGFLYRKLFSRKCNIIYEVSDLHTLMIDSQSKLLSKFISKVLIKVEEILCRSVSLLIVTSENFYEKFYKDMIPKDKVLFIPNTPDSSVFNNFQRKVHEKFTVGFIGAIRYADQIEMLIDASVEANVNVFIAGGGKDYSRIKDYAKNYENVEVYGEYKYEEEIKHLYERVDCIYSVYDVKLTNVQIALPNRLYEAAYTATPLIVSKNTYLGDLVEGYEIGKTISFDSKSELIETLLYFKQASGYTKRFEEKVKVFKRDWDLNKYNKNLLDAIGNIN